MPKEIQQINSLASGINNDTHQTNIADDEAVNLVKANVTSIGSIKKIGDETQYNDRLSNLGTNFTFDIEAGMGLRLLYSDVSLNKISNGSFKTFEGDNLILNAGFSANADTSQSGDIDAEDTVNTIQINGEDPILINCTLTNEDSSAHNLGADTWMGTRVNMLTVTSSASLANAMFLPSYNTSLATGKESDWDGKRVLIKLKWQMEVDMTGVTNDPLVKFKHNSTVLEERKISEITKLNGSTTSRFPKGYSFSKIIWWEGLDADDFTIEIEAFTGATPTVTFFIWDATGNAIDLEGVSSTRNKNWGWTIEDNKYFHQDIVKGMGTRVGNPKERVHHIGENFKGQNIKPRETEIINGVSQLIENETPGEDKERVGHALWLSNEDYTDKSISQDEIELEAGKTYILSWWAKNNNKRPTSYIRSESINDTSNDSDDREKIWRKQGNERFYGDNKLKISTVNLNSSVSSNTQYLTNSESWNSTSITKITSGHKKMMILSDYVYRANVSDYEVPKNFSSPYFKDSINSSVTDSSYGIKWKTIGCQTNDFDLSHPDSRMYNSYGFDGQLAPRFLPNTTGASQAKSSDIWHPYSIKFTVPSNYIPDVDGDPLKFKFDFAIGRNNQVIMDDIQLVELDAQEELVILGYSGYNLKNYASILINGKDLPNEWNEYTPAKGTSASTYINDIYHVDGVLRFGGSKGLLGIYPSVFRFVNFHWFSNRTAGPLNTSELHEGGDIWFDCAFTPHDTARAISLSTPHSHFEDIEGGNSTKRIFNGDSEFGNTQTTVAGWHGPFPTNIFISWVPDSEQDDIIWNTQANGVDPLSSMNVANLVPIEVFGGDLTRPDTSPGSYYTDPETGEGTHGFYFTANNPVGVTPADLTYHYPGILFKPKHSDYGDDLVGKSFKVRATVALPRGNHAITGNWSGPWSAYNNNITGSLCFFDIDEDPTIDEQYWTERNEDSFTMLSGDTGSSDSIPIYPYTSMPSFTTDSNTFKTVSFIWTPQHKKSSLYLSYVGDDIGVLNGWSDDIGAGNPGAKFWFDNVQITEIPSNEGYGTRGAERRDRYWSFDKAFFDKPKAGISDVSRVNGDDEYGSYSNLFYKINDTGVTKKNMVTGSIANNKLEKIDSIDFTTAPGGYGLVMHKECAFMDATTTSAPTAAASSMDITVTEEIDEIDGGTCFKFSPTSAASMTNEFFNEGTNYFSIYENDAGNSHKGISCILYIPTSDDDNEGDAFIPLRKYTLTCKVKGKFGDYYNIAGESSHYFQASPCNPFYITDNATGGPYEVIGGAITNDANTLGNHSTTLKPPTDDEWTNDNSASEVVKLQWDSERWHTYRCEFMIAHKDSQDIGIKFTWFNNDIAATGNHATSAIGNEIFIKDIKVVDSAATALHGSTFIMNRLPEVYDGYKYWNATTPLACNMMGGPDIPENLETQGYATNNWETNLGFLNGEQYGTKLSWKALYTQLGIPENSGRYKHIVDSNSQGISGQYFWMVKIPSYHRDDNFIYGANTMSMKNVYWKMPIFKRADNGFTGHLKAGWTGNKVKVISARNGTYTYEAIETNATTNNNLVRGWKHVWTGFDEDVKDRNIYNKVEDLNQNSDLLELGISYGTGKDYTITTTTNSSADGLSDVDTTVALDGSFSNSFSRGGFSRARLSKLKPVQNGGVAFTPDGSSYPDRSTYRVYDPSAPYTTMGTGGFYPLGVDNDYPGASNAGAYGNYVYENTEEIILEHPFQLTEMQAYMPDAGRGVCVLAPPEGSANLSIYVSPGGGWSNTASSKWEFGYTYVYYSNQESDIYWYPDNVDLHSGFTGDSSKLRDGFQLEMYPVIHMGFPKGVEGLRFYAKKTGDKNAFLVMNCHFEKGVQSNGTYTSDEWTPWQCLRDLEDTWTHNKNGNLPDKFTQGIISGIGNIDQEPATNAPYAHKQLGYSIEDSTGTVVHKDKTRIPNGEVPDGNDGTTANTNNNFYDSALSGEDNFHKNAEGFEFSDQRNYHNKYNQTFDTNEGSKLKLNNQVWTSAKKVISKSVGFTFESINGFNYGENPFFSKEGEGWATSILLNRKMYIGNVRKYDKNNILRAYPDEMWISQVGKYDTFPSKNKLSVTINDGDEVIALHQFNDRILQFKRNNLFVINCSEDVEFLEGKYPFMGLEFKNSAISTEMGVVWVNSHGVYHYNGDNIQSLLHREGEGGGIRTISKDDWKSFAVDGNGKTLPMLITYSAKHKSIYIYDKGTETTRGWKYHIITKSWVHLDDNGAGGIRFNDNTKERTNYQVSNTGDPIAIKVDENNTNLMIVKFDEEDIDGMTASTNFKIVTKEFNFGTPSVLKNFLSLNVTYKSTGDTLIIPEYSTDGGATWNTFDSSASRFYPVSGACLDVGGLLTTGGEEKIARLKTSGTSSLKDIKTIQFKFDSGSLRCPVDFEISSIEILYRQRGVRS